MKEKRSAHLVGPLELLRKTLFVKAGSHDGHVRALVAQVQEALACHLLRPEALPIRKVVREG